MPLHLGRFRYTTDALKTRLTGHRTAVPLRARWPSPSAEACRLLFAFGGFDGIFLLKAPVGWGAADGDRGEWRDHGRRDDRAARHGRGPGDDAQGRRGDVSAARLVSNSA
jgi:hypothetical protein